MAFNQRLSAEIEPAGPAWRSAAAADRLAYFAAAGELAVKLKRAELARAIGANGRRMKARKHPRPDGADGPVMTPHDEASRTARLMASHADPRGMTLFWRSGHGGAQRLPWGTILGFHAGGFVEGAPKRDVRLSKAGIARVRREMAIWWAARSADKARRDDRAEAMAAGKPGRSILGRIKDAVASRFGKATPQPRPFGKSPGSHAEVRAEQARIAARYKGYGDHFRDPRDGF